MITVPGGGNASSGSSARPEGFGRALGCRPYPRAQAFYRKHGFVPDMTSKIDDGVREIRMVRSSKTPIPVR